MEQRLKKYIKELPHLLVCKLESGQEKCLYCGRVLEILEYIYVFSFCSHWICAECCLENDSDFFCPKSCNVEIDGLDERCFFKVTDKVVETWCPLKTIRVKIEEDEKEEEVKGDWFQRDEELRYLRKRVRELEQTVEKLSKRNKL